MFYNLLRGLTLLTVHGEVPLTAGEVLNELAKKACPYILMIYNILIFLIKILSHLVMYVLQVILYLGSDIAPTLLSVAERKLKKVCAIHWNKKKKNARYIWIINHY